MLEVGVKAPDFELPDQNGKIHRLSDYAGKKVVLYFYSKDNTAGCTKQACGFSERYPQFIEKGAVILGVSIIEICYGFFIVSKLEFRYTCTSVRLCRLHSFRNCCLVFFKCCLIISLFQILCSLFIILCISHIAACQKSKA